MAERSIFLSPLARIVVAAASLAAIIPIVADTARTNQAELVQPIGIALELSAIVLGIAVGAVLARAWDVNLRQGQGTLLARLSLGMGVDRTGHNVPIGRRAFRGLGGWLMAMVLMIGAALTATKMARDMVMWRAFTGVTAPAVPERFTIVDKVREGRRTRAHLRVHLATGGRTFNVRVSADAYSAARMGDTLMLPVEIGRGGLQRMVPPDTPIERAALRSATSDPAGAARGG